MSTWNKDMSAAPKDGTNIFVWAAGFSWPDIIRWEAFDEETAEELGEQGFWRYSEDLIADVAEVNFVALTHWMLIQAPA